METYLQKGNPVAYKAILEKYQGYLKLRNFSSRTIDFYMSALSRFTAYITKERGITRAQDIKREDLRDYQNKVHCSNNKRTGQPLSLSCKANLIVVVRSFFRYLVKTGELMYNPASDIEIPRVRKEHLREALKERDMRRIITAADEKTLTGIRDRAILEVLYSTGMRNTELRELRLGDIDLEAFEVKVRCGKGGKGRVLPLGRVASSYVEEYLVRSRPILVKGSDTDYLFLSIKGGGRGIGMSVPIYLVKKYALKARLKNKKVSPHVIRHTCATHLLRGGADIRYVQELLGHASLDSTRIYTKVEISDLKKVHSKTHPRERI